MQAHVAVYDNTNAILIKIYNACAPTQCCQQSSLQPLQGGSTLISSTIAYTPLLYLPLDSVSLYASSAAPEACNPLNQFASIICGVSVSPWAGDEWLRAVLRKGQETGHRFRTQVSVRMKKLYVA